MTIKPEDIGFSQVYVYRENIYNAIHIGTNLGNYIVSDVFLDVKGNEVIGKICLVKDGNSLLNDINLVNSLRYLIAFFTSNIKEIEDRYQLNPLFIIENNGIDARISLKVGNTIINLASIFFMDVDLIKKNIVM